MVFIVFLLGANHDKGSVGNKPSISIGSVWQRHLTLYLMPSYLKLQTNDEAKQSAYCGAKSNKGLVNNTQQFI